MTTFQRNRAIPSEQCYGIQEELYYYDTLAPAAQVVLPVGNRVQSQSRYISASTSFTRERDNNTNTKNKASLPVMVFHDSLFIEEVISLEANTIGLRHLRYGFARGVPKFKMNSISYFTFFISHRLCDHHGCINTRVAPSLGFARGAILTALLFFLYQNFQSALCSSNSNWSLNNDGAVADTNSERPSFRSGGTNDNVIQGQQQLDRGLHQDGDLEDDMIHRVLIREQERFQAEFQALLRANQYPRSSTTNCFDRRLLLTPTRKKALDGFALEFQDLARQLQIAYTTDLTLVTTSQWKSAYASCKNNSTSRSSDESGDWTCLWNRSRIVQPRINCNIQITNA